MGRGVLPGRLAAPRPTGLDPLLVGRGVDLCRELGHAVTTGDRGPHTRAIISGASGWLSTLADDPRIADASLSERLRDVADDLERNRTDGDPTMAALTVDAVLTAIRGDGAGLDTTALDTLASELR